MKSAVRKVELIQLEGSELTNEVLTALRKKMTNLL